MAYEFQGSLYRTPRGMCDAIVEMWLCAHGKNKRADMLEALATMTNQQLADECIEGWGLDEEILGQWPCVPDLPLDEQPELIGKWRPITWMEEREISRGDIVRAFGDLREDFDARFPEAG